jgi:Planctomycete cytochrome C/Cytochrome b(C-terminal)/b6/petD
MASLEDRQAVPAPPPTRPPKAMRTMHERISPSARGSFWPDAVFQTTVLVAIVFTIMLVLSIVNPAPLGTPADPLNKEGFLPRPAWYFYVLFIVLEIFKGPILVLVGALVVPTVIIGAMLLLPFYDRNPSRRPGKRPVAMLTGYGIMAITVAFTIFGVATAPPQPSAQAASTGPVANPTYDKDIQPIFQSSGCNNCHGNGQAQGGLSLASAQSVLSTGDHKPVVKAGDPDTSLLVQKVAGTQTIGAQMPLGGKPLSADAVTTIKNWVKDGAK